MTQFKCALYRRHGNTIRNNNEEIKQRKVLIMKKLSLILACLMLVMALAGCATDKPENDNPTGTPETDTPSGAPETDVPEDSDRAVLEQYIDLLGKDNQALIDLLGNGEENKDDAGTVLSRVYTVTLFGEEVPLTVALDVGTVHDISADLTGAEYDSWFTKLKDAFGEPSDITEPDAEEGNDTQAGTWELTGGTVVLMSAYGSIALSVYKTAA